MKRVTSDFTPSGARANQTLMEISVLGVMGLVMLVLLINPFFIESVTHFNGNGGAESYTQMLFGFVAPCSFTPVFVVNGVLILGWAALIGLAIIVLDPDWMLADAVEIISCFLVLASLIIVFASFVVSSKYPHIESPDAEVSEDVLGQEYDADQQSPLYTLTEAAEENGKGDTFARGLSKKETPQRMIDDTSVDTETTYKNFKIVEVSEGENHLFSYDSSNRIKLVSDVVDLGKLSQSDFETFKTFVKTAD